MAADLVNGESILAAVCASCHAGGYNTVVPVKKIKKDVWALLEIGPEACGHSDLFAATCGVASRSCSCRAVGFRSIRCNMRGSVPILFLL